MAPALASATPAFESASAAALRAASAEPWAAPTFWSTTPILLSLALVRSCVSSTVFESDSTLPFTPVICWFTYPFVAHAGKANTTAPSTASPAT